MTERFFSPQPLVVGGTVLLEGSESHHLAHVLRLAVDDEIGLFDGDGHEATARIEATNKRGTRLVVREVRRDAPPTRPSFTLATAVPKGDRFRWLVEKATELGVDRLVPLSTERSVVDPRETKLDKMRQAVIAACKQCRRNRLMELSATQTFEQALKSAAESAMVLLADPGGGPVSGALNRRPAGTPLVAVIGPEGGLTDREREMAFSLGAERVSLGSGILRMETAAIAVAARCLVD